MELDIPRFIPVRSGIYIIKVSTYVDKRFCGSLYCPNTGHSYRFNSLAQLLLLLQRQMDEANFPQRGMESRATWSAPESDCLAVSSPAETGGPHLATFKLNVLFRQNASWQGNIVWSDKNASSNFRSVLELIELMDSALTTAACE